ncbi:RNase P modulator RnpM [Virgibacillus soli]|uniref:YlxR family protein n=1 Tax=Paracerasibacillus soli TaxID=480284 RepID=A0ABU5CQX5_9BACI|nr:YlxR family protein [Virgibacillus soli]MDY0408192.1 YlxR family protein [Virgibacillus soli]
MVRQRKVPLRKCVVTQEMKPKQSLIRIVRNKDGEVSVDLTGKMNGRGAYVSRDLQTILKAEKSNVLARHLNTEIDSSVYEELKQLVDSDE